jgi:hypothetical protein
MEHARVANFELRRAEALIEHKCGGLGPTRANFISPRACSHCGTRIR